MTKKETLPSPIVAGLKCRCPQCGEGPLFSSYLKISSQCESCGLDLEFADSGDGPAIFIIFIVGFIVIALALIVDVAFHPSVIVHLIIWLPMTVILCLAFLPPFKAIMVALQFKNEAREGRSD